MVTGLSPVMRMRQWAGRLLGVSMLPAMVKGAAMGRGTGAWGGRGGGGCVLRSCGGGARVGRGGCWEVRRGGVLRVCGVDGVEADEAGGWGGRGVVRRDRS